MTVVTPSQEMLIPRNQTKRTLVLRLWTTCFFNARTNTNVAVRGPQMHSSTYPGLIKYTWNSLKSTWHSLGKLNYRPLKIMINLRLCLLANLQTIVTINFSRFSAAMKLPFNKTIEVHRFIVISIDYRSSQVSIERWSLIWNVSNKIAGPFLLQLLV